ncbi:exodeoxyribonuclease VII large subunit [Alkalibacillus haloalkaliphilus]|uniref:Exodeoxyribonuclease 7 large subunit n=1 Tax=Alkalibacillus haloalkaliphilus TaxID=94136 RepID=A0A511W4M4_9BACI|nr:exodeoxyribonuclease VII large subunit [Alkalibacillus haloalkaliphilus]GEN45278.1 exodeoxyribonuclease 7 large subunit [Alkalibacillus haloalkaliphilus]
MKQQYLTVTALTKYIKKKFDVDRHLKNVWLQGEISNFNHHSRGHMYFTIKDENARVSAVMFASSNRSLKFKPENGMKVLVHGDISVYERSGQYQIYVSSMEPDGLGSLHLAYEQLKKKLNSEGLFNEEFKKPIPKFPEKIGIVTSPTGAAVRDIITTLARRYPHTKRVVIPVSVQGEFASKSIADGINEANNIGDFDTLIVGRGGGSIEELWAFNEEVVARAISQSTIPVISAVGHETDFTISDLVADLRAPTPTAAAELAVPSLDELHKQVEVTSHRLQQQMKQKVNTLNERLNSLRNAYAFKYPVHLTRQKEQDLDRVVLQLNKNIKQAVHMKKQNLNSSYDQLVAHSPSNLLKEKRNQTNYVTEKLNQVMASNHKQKQHEFNTQIEKLSILSPLETMKRGYSIAYNENDDIVKSTKSVETGGLLKVSFTDGQVVSQVQRVEERDDRDGE